MKLLKLFNPLKQLSIALLSFLILSISYGGFSQNINDPYKDIEGFGFNVYPTGINDQASYTGEYQFYLPTSHPWSQSNLYVRVKTECLSFPFLPTHQYHQAQNTSGQPIRQLGIPNSNTVIGTNQKYYDMNDYFNPGTNSANWTFSSLGFQGGSERLFTKFDGEAWHQTSSGGGRIASPQNNTEFNTLISKFFADPNGPHGSVKRNMFPHSILKHTLIIAEKCNGTYYPIDSLEYIVDLTRGQMNRYPFNNGVLNSGSSEHEHEHDVQIKFEALAPAQYGTSNTSFYPYPLYNYFPETNANYLYTPNCGITNKYIPSTYPNSGNFTPYDYVKLPQHSLTGVLVCNQDADSRAGYKRDLTTNTIEFLGLTTANEHVYVIDQPYDIKTINPSERIVYNPKEVSIHLNHPKNTGSHTLTFPSGYTFKPVLRKYPSLAEMTASDPHNYYGKKPLQIPIKQSANTVVDKSKYIVQDGTTLIIENCVTILDTEIEVKTGGILIYNSSATYGNYTITNSGGTVTNNTANGNCLASCLNTTPTASDWNDYTINTNKTVNANTTKRVFGTLTIAPGKILTIKEGARLEFAPNSEIVIENGGNLIINGLIGNQVILTSMCDNMWNGIELRGKSNSLTTVFMDYTQVENALTGVQTYSSKNKLDYYGSVSTGNGTFLNCIKGLDIITPINSGCCPYSNTIYKTTFKTTDALVDSRFTINHPHKPTITHVKVSGVRNKVSFTECTFENLNTWLLPHEKGIGIETADSWLLLGKPNTTDVNTFKNLSVGILMQDRKQYSLTNIHDAVFTDNIYGIILLNRSYASIYNNTFTVPASTSTGGGSSSPEIKTKMYERPTGIMTKNSSGFYIYENTFSGTPTPAATNSCDNCNQAIVVDGTANAIKHGNGLVMSNTFSDINMGLLAQNGNGTNSSAPPGEYIAGTGVSSVCNSFTDLTTYDFALPFIPTGPFGSGAVPIRNQGHCQNNGNSNFNHPALNIYNLCTQPQTRNIHNLSDKFYYYHANSNTPACKQNVDLSICNYVFNSISNTEKCNDYFANFDPLALSLTGKRQTYLDKLVELEGRILDFTNLLDNGSTSGLLDLVQNAALSEVVNALNESGSYISDAVLLAAIDKLAAEESENLLVILQNNSKLSKTVWNAVLNHSPTFSSGFINTLSTSQEGISARKSYVEWIDYTAYERNTIFDGLYIADLLDDENLSVSLDVLRNQNNLFARKKLLPLLISAYQFNEAHDLLNTIKETESTSLFLYENEARLLMAENGIGFNELPSEITTKLKDYWNESPQQSSWSGIASGNQPWQFYIQPQTLIAPSESAKWSGSQSSNTLNVEKENTLQCVPNPTLTGGMVQGVLQNADQTENSIRIYNSIGQLVATQSFNTSEFQYYFDISVKGLYFVNIYQNNVPVMHQKWVVQ
jgi:hypothetical protein